MEPSSWLVASMEGLIGFETIEIRMVDKIIVFCFFFFLNKVDELFSDLI